MKVLTGYVNSKKEAGLRIESECVGTTSAAGTDLSFFLYITELGKFGYCFGYRGHADHQLFADVGNAAVSMADAQVQYSFLQSGHISTNLRKYQYICKCFLKFFKK